MVGVVLGTLVKMVDVAPGTASTFGERYMSLILPFRTSYSHRNTASRRRRSISGDSGRESAFHHDDEPRMGRSQR